MANPWFKFYGSEYLSDPKFLGMDSHNRSCWLTLLSYCSLSEELGVVRYLTEDLLMMQAGVPLGGEEWRKTQGVLERFEEKGMVHIKDDCIEICNWTKKQESFLTPAERSNRYRNKQRDIDVTNVTLEENRIDKNREKVADAPSTCVFERKILEKDEEYRELVKDLAAHDYLTPARIHKIVLEEFLPYWLERSDGGKKSRWEREKVFDYQRRVRTWIKNFHRNDHICSEGMWHRKDERCYCKPEEPVIERVISPERMELIKTIVKRP